MAPDPDLPSWLPDAASRHGLRQRLHQARRALRRTVLARRRLLAAALTAVAVAAALQVLAPDPPPAVPVLTAAADLPAGTVLGPDDVATVRRSPGAVPSGVLRPEEALGQRLASPLRSGEPVTDVRVVAPALLAGRPGLVAVPLRIPDAGAVALLDVGDRVAVLATDPRGTEPAVPVVTDAPVLALPRPSADRAGAPRAAAGGAAGGRLVLLALTPEQARLAAAMAVRSYLSITLGG